MNELNGVMQQVENQANSLDSTEMQRYQRHLQLPQIGTQGQHKLKQSTVVIVGCGGLGVPVALYLAAAGVGYITVVDADVIELSNLQRQVIYTEDCVGKSKAENTKIALTKLNSSISVEAIQQALSPDNAHAILKGANLVLDCTDNFATRYLINDVCLQLEKPWVYASIHQFSGQIAMFLPGGPCFRCLFPELPKAAPDCNDAGVLGVLPGILGTMQACEALKHLLGLPTVANELLMVEAMDMQFHKIALRHNQACRCSHERVDWIADDPFYARFCSDSSDSAVEISSADLKRKLELNDDVCFVDVRQNEEHQTFNLGGQNVPLEQLESWLKHSSPANKELVFYCQSGMRSASACLIAEQQGINATSLRGGINLYLQENA
ncbi:MAG: ThiF family adenylyltransferase [Pseudomonadales bacterium]